MLKLTMPEKQDVSRFIEADRVLRFVVGTL